MPLFAAALVAATVLGPFAKPASAILVWAGACQITLSTSSSPLGPLPAHPKAISVSGGGPCVTNVGVVTMTITSLTLMTNPATGGFGCFAGIASGVGDVKLSDPSFPSVQVEFTAVNTGGVVSVVGISQIFVFDGAAAFVIDPLKLASCAAGTPMTNATWTGALAFQDPVIDEA
jgi:hypothetical protein